MKMIPDMRPQWTRKKLLDALTAKGIKPEGKVFVVGVRGYYLDSMGKPGVNDRSLYDDALFVVGPDTFESFNANTDPSAYKFSVASLKVGVWRYKPGLHGITFSKPGYPYPAFVQAGEVVVKRDGKNGDFKGWFGINIHRGGRSVTSSLGCQTVPPTQWNEFRKLVISELKTVGQSEFEYILIEGQG